MNKTPIRTIYTVSKMTKKLASFMGSGILRRFKAGPFNFSILHDKFNELRIFKLVINAQIVQSVIRPANAD